MVMTKLDIFDKMLFSGPDCSVYNCLYNIVGKCTQQYDNIQPQVSGYGHYYLSCDCKKSHLKIP